jgi:putative flavoprotein involved in K+ transport
VTYHPEKVVGVRDGRPELADGTVLDVANVVWCTGFGKDTGWITFPCLGADGWPDQKEGVATGVPGLYFVGLPFLWSFSSMLIGGVGRDAESVARHITMQRDADRRATPVPVAERRD